MSDLRTLAQRFWHKVRINPDSGCWEWINPEPGSGYGRMQTSPGVSISAHRWAYETFVAPIPEGLQIDHLCRNRACVNPNHLEPVTCKENINRTPKVAHRAQRITCSKGHPYTESNVRIDPNGRWICKTCHRESTRQSRERRKARS